MKSLVIEQRRGFAVEGRHEIDAVVCDASGRITALVGEDANTTFRSAAKPFQLEESLAALDPALRARLSSEDFAIGAASHHGETMHVQQVVQLLSKLDRSPGHLYCGAHAPSHAASAQALYAAGAAPSVLHNNCSGKHTFMAAACAAQGWDTDYLAPTHPLQQRILTRMNERAGGTVRGVVIDGCGLPCYVLPLSGMARAWAQVAVAMGGNANSADASLGTIGRAMHQHPVLMSGSDAFDGWLTQSTSALAKVGAQGLLCAALPEQGLGLAMKIRSGGDAVRPVAAWTLLREWFASTVGEELPERFSCVKNAVGKTVGDIHARWSTHPAQG
jgi:L-asparaginase II